MIAQMEKRSILYDRRPNSRASVGPIFLHGERVSIMCFGNNNNNGCLWIVIIIILLFCGNGGNNCGCGNNNGCGCGCN